MRGRTARASLPALAVPLLVLLAAACAGGPRPRGTPAGGVRHACWETRYRLRLGDGEHVRNGRLVARACDDGRLLAEVRGKVGSPILVAAVRGGRVRLLLPRRREAVDGPDDPAFWNRWTGIPLPGGTLLERRPRPGGGRRSLRAGDWKGEVWWSPASVDPCPFPTRLSARDSRGGFLVAVRVRARRVEEGPPWPAVPPGFTRPTGAGGPRGEGS